MKALYDVPAPAKLNLFLHITGRRDDGYHLLQSVFMLLDWSDVLHFELRNDGLIGRTDLNAPLPEDDLIVRAARLLQRHARVNQGVQVSVQKNLPAQAGLGGGSSDAASTLLALNRLWDLNLDVATLAQLAVQLGADVPFFVHGRNAWVEGIGDRITPLTGEAALPPQMFCVIKPEAGLATAKIFSDEGLERQKPPAIISGFAADHYGFGSNVLQPVAERLCPEISQALQWLADQGLKGRMTGSGSAVFAPSSGSVDVSSAPSGWIIKQCSNLAVHPLVGWAPK
jgi:4-diphosphocytidyl-2-C-methyl-D-erythritol kinase